MASIAIASGIFTITFGLIISRPKTINEGMAAILGAVLMLIFGLVSFHDIYSLIQETGSLLIMLFAMMIISYVMDESGFFMWAAGKATAKAGGSGKKLFRNTFIMGTLITTVISNDATALIITPIVYNYVSALGLNPLPFLLACTFIADTASLSLPVSNLTNLLVFEQLNMAFGPYIITMFLPTLFAIFINYFLFCWIFRKDISEPIDQSKVSDFNAKVKNKSFFMYSVFILSLIIAFYIIGSTFGIPLVVVSVLGALLLVAGGKYHNAIDEKSVFSNVSYSVLFFVIGMFIIVRGLQNSGLTLFLAEKLIVLSNESLFKSILFTSFGTALGSNVINNVPMDLLMISVIKDVGHPEFLMPMGYATILGAGLGPNLTVIGSLATMLWVSTIKRKNIHITPAQYLKVGLMVTPLMILCSSIALYWSIRLIYKL